MVLNGAESEGLLSSILNLNNKIRNIDSVGKEFNNGAICKWMWSKCPTTSHFLITPVLTLASVTIFLLILITKTIVSPETVKNMKC